MDDRTKAKSGYALVVLMAACACSAIGQNADAEWLGWGGPNGDFRLDQTRGLTESFGDRPPIRLWKRELGDGYSGIVVKANRLFTQYRVDDREVIAALDVADGKTLWEQTYPVQYYENMYPGYGKGPNASPLAMGDRLFTVSVHGELRCTELDSGKLVWRLDLHERYGRQQRKEEYGFSSSPIAYQGRLIVLVGGDKHGVAALDPADGRQIWGSPPSRVSYAQPAMIRVDGRDQMVFFSPTHIVGMDPENGAFLWRYPVECSTENNLTPALQLDDRHIWAAAQLDGGTRVLALPPGGRQNPKALWETNKIKQAHWNSVAIGDYVYGSFGGNFNSYLAAVNWRTGEFAWRQRGFHLAKGVFADGKFYFTDENGQLVIARFSPQKVDILDAFQLLSRKSWTPPTLVGSKLYLRDQKQIVAVELAAKAYEARAAGK